MANNDRWRNSPQQSRYHDSAYGSHRDEDFRRGDRFGREGWSVSGGRRGIGNRGGMGGGTGDTRDQRVMAHPRGGRASGGGYGAEGYASSYQDYSRGSDERGFGGNDYYQGFYGADQGYPGDERGPSQDVWGSRGGRSGRGRFGDEVSSRSGNDEAAHRREQDARQGDWGAQHHRGRGPKGYRRSDERIREDVCDRLTDDPVIDASDIEVSVSNGEVTLSGTVGSREIRRRAEDCIESISGVTHVQNNLRVQQRSPASQGSAAGHAGRTGMSGMQDGAAEAGHRDPAGDDGERRARAGT